MYYHNEKVLKAHDVYAYLAALDKSVPVEWCELTEFPFIL